MRPLPISDAVLDQFPGGKRVTIGGDGYTPCEYIAHYEYNEDGTAVRRRLLVTSIVALTDDEREAIADGAMIVYTTEGGELPWSLSVTEAP